MSLRAKLAALFAVLAVLPLVAVGVFDYSRSLQAVEALILAQTREIAERAADQLATRYRMLEANVALLAQNTETMALYRSRVASRADGLLAPASREYLEEMWRAVRGPIASVSYRNATGAELYRMADDGTAGERPGGPGRHVIVREIRDDRDALLGHARIVVRLDSVLPRGVLGPQFGRSGFSAVIDERGDSVVITSGPTGERARRLRSALDGGYANVLDSGDSNRRQISAFRIRDRDSTRIGTRVRLAIAPYSVVAVGTLEEFAAPLERIRTSNLAIVLAVTLAVAAAFALFLWRATRSLSALTAAADVVSRGNLRPPLPPAGRDEVGRLTGAFEYMLARVRETMQEIERSRHMRAVGEFASQIAHEIRNPLTSIKLNLQKLDRARQRGALNAELERPVEISLSEIHRLDNVVHGVLRLGRRDAAVRTPLEGQRVIADAVEITRSQLEAAGVHPVVRLDAIRDRVLGDAVLLQSVITNLLTNAAEAMPRGGTVYVTCENGSLAGRATLRCRVEDDGAGVAAGDRDRLFQPFFTTKPRGTGLGLALAQRAVEEHHGQLTLDVPRRGTGAAFVLDLPLATGEAT